MLYVHPISTPASPEGALSIGDWARGVKSSIRTARSRGSCMFGLHDNGARRLNGIDLTLLPRSQRFHAKVEIA